MTRTEKIEFVLKVLAHHSEGWIKITDKQLDDLLLITDAYLKVVRVKELDAIIAKAQAEKTEITKVLAIR